MSMSVPVLWQEVEWKKAWGPYYTWDADAQRLEPNDISGHSVVLYSGYWPPGQDKIGHLSKAEIAQLPDAWRMHQ
jgi:hypothetical protein